MLPKRRFLLGSGVALLVALFLLTGCGSSQTPAGVQEGVTDEGYPYVGSLGAPVVIVEFSDFQ